MVGSAAAVTDKSLMKVAAFYLLQYQTIVNSAAFHIQIYYFKEIRLKENVWHF